VIIRYVIPTGIPIRPDIFEAKKQFPAFYMKKRWILKNQRFSFINFMRANVRKFDPTAFSFLVL
jgi:hypothetical protein